MDEVRADETTIDMPAWAQTWTTVRWIWAAVLLVWLVLIYSPSFNGPYVFDDLGNVLKKLLPAAPHENVLPTVTPQASSQAVL